MTLKLYQNISQISPELGNFGLELHRFVEGLAGLFEASQQLEGDPKRCEIFNLWLLPDCVRSPIDGPVILLRMNADLPHQMQ